MHSGCERAGLPGDEPPAVEFFHSTHGLHVEATYLFDDGKLSILCSRPDRTGRVQTPRCGFPSGLGVSRHDEGPKHERAVGATNTASLASPLRLLSVARSLSCSKHWAGIGGGVCMGLGACRTGQRPF